MAGKDTSNDKKSTPGAGSPVTGSRRERRATAAGAGSTRPSAQRPDETYASSPLSMGNIRSGVLRSMAVKVVLGLLIVIFAVGFMFTSFGGNNNPGNPSGVGGGGPDPVAHVGAEAVPRGQFEMAAQRQIEMLKQYGQPTGVDKILDYRHSTLQSLSGQAALVETARREGLTASGDEIDAKIKLLIEEPLKGEGSQAVNTRRQIEAQFGSVEAYEAEQRKEMDRDAVERMLLIEKLEKKVKDENKVTEEDYKKSVTKLKLRQIVIRPKFPGPNDKDPKAAQEKNEKEAEARAAKIAGQLKANPTLENFIALAKKESDDTATKTKGGDLGWKLPTDPALPLSPAVKDALLKTDGNLVGPVHDEATHESTLLWIESRKLELPKDYAKKKAELLKNYETERDNQAWEAFQETAKKQVATQIADPMMEAYKIHKEQLLTATGDEANKLRQAALDKYQEALNYAAPPEAAAIHYQMAQLYRDLDKQDKAVEGLQAALKAAPGDATVQVELAQMLRLADKKKEAVAQLNTLSKQLDESPSPPSMFGTNPDDEIRLNMAAEYEALGMKDMASRERKKIKPAPGGMGGFNMGGAGGGTIQIPPR